MNQYSWKDQLFNDHPITIPLYSGNGLNHNEFNEKDELNDQLIINEIKLDDYDDHLDSYVKVIVDYKIMKDDLIIDKRVDTS